MVDYNCCEVANFSYEYDNNKQQHKVCVIIKEISKTNEVEHAEWDGG